MTFLPTKSTHHTVSQTVGLSPIHFRSQSGRPPLSRDAPLKSFDFPNRSLLPICRQPDLEGYC